MLNDPDYCETCGNLNDDWGMCWECKTATQPREGIRKYNVGHSNYSQYKIQPWDIWLEYKLNPWDADIVKRVLRTKPGERRLDYEKIKHICDERIRQIDEGLT